VSAPIIWKEITTAFRGRVIGGSYTVEDGIVRVRTTLGQKIAQLGGVNAALIAWRLLRELAAEGKA
jgi:predicted metalloendopeptidase